MSRSLRQIHRWTAVAFTVSIIVTAVALAQEEPLPFVGGGIRLGRRWDSGPV
jgi:hypothetical protein